MPPSVDDPRRVPGNKVHAKATVVMHESSAQRRYGSNWKTCLVPGIVESVHVRPGKGKTNRKATWIKVRFFLGRNNDNNDNNDNITKNTEVKEVLVGNLKAGFPPDNDSTDKDNDDGDAKMKPRATPSKIIVPKSFCDLSTPKKDTPIIAALSPVQKTPQHEVPIENQCSQTGSRVKRGVSFAKAVCTSSNKGPSDANERKQGSLNAVRLALLSGNIDRSNASVVTLLGALNMEENPADLDQDMKAINDEDDSAYDSNNDELPTPYKKTRKYQEESAASHAINSTNATHAGREQRASKNNDEGCVTEANDIKWYEDEHDMTKTGMGKPIAPHQWRLRSQYNPGITVTDGSNKDQHLEPFDIFMMMFPKKQLQDIVQFTNQRLAGLAEPKAPVTEGEVLKFFGIIILGTFVEFDSRKDLWTKRSDNKYMAAPNFAKTGMSRDRFLTLFVQLRYSYQPEKKPAGMSSETYRWMLVDDHETNFNEHRATYYNPSLHIIIDELFSRWYGLGGHYINIGLPMYVAIDRKPEDGCEVQCSGDGVTGVMLRLQIVRSAEEEDRLKSLYPMPWHKESLHHGAQVALALVQPWLGTNRLVGGDSYFASVNLADELESQYWTGFVGTIKTATKGFPQKYLSTYICEGNRGDSKVVVRKDDNGVPSMMAIMTVDRNRNYYVATRGSTKLSAVSRIRWTQAKNDKQADAIREEIKFERPEVVNIFHSFASKIDQHNACRQEMLKLETTWKTHNWHIRCNMTLLGVSIVDSWLVYQAATSVEMKQRKFYSILAEQLIDNKWDSRSGLLFRDQKQESNAEPPVPMDIPDGNAGLSATNRPHGIGLHLTPVKEKNSRGFTSQARCRYPNCRRQVTTECNICYALFCQGEGTRFFCCKPDRTDHWNCHMEEYHGISMAAIIE